MTLNILTLNVNGLRLKEKPLELKNFIQAECADVVFLQETNLREGDGILSDQFHAFLNPANDGQKSGSGTAVIVPIHLLSVGVWSHTILERGYCQRLYLENLHLDLINVYIPHDNNKAHSMMIILRDALEDAKQAGKGVILGGDWNMVLEASDIFPALPSPRRPHLANELRYLVHVYSLADPYAILPPTSITGSKFTFEKSSGTKSRLDKFYLNSEIKISVVSLKTTPVEFSDHSGVCMRINVGLIQFSDMRKEYR